ncbi:heme exporter protein CcmB [Congregibacter variabilis]|uniref:Heme exporter protein B n=1 Tax=Congregibacter variabilis TaxID=3081200 RepID=A0ABZ0I4N4_9GAMM|nr:heme exporter protein CcmB [Congregibacter sp. IMCC43200]
MASTVYLAMLRRQLTLALRRPVQLLNPALFFAIVIVLFPLGLGPAPDTLSMFAGGILWIVALLANMLGAETLFQSDYDDGSLDQLLIAQQPLYFLVMPYLLVQWLLSGLLLAFLSPVFALMLGLPQQGVVVLMASLALGSGVMSVLGAIGAALTVGLRRGGMLIGLLVTPFYMPVLIFGSGAVSAAVDGLAFAPYLAVLGAMFSLAIALGPVAIAAALRISADA